MFEKFHSMKFWSQCTGTVVAGAQHIMAGNTGQRSGHFTVFGVWSQRRKGGSQYLPEGLSPVT